MMSIIVYLCVVAPSASGKIDRVTTGLSRYRTDASQTKPTTPAEVPKSAHDNRHNASSTSTQRTKTLRRNRNRNKRTPRDAALRKNATKVRASGEKILSQSRVATPTKQRRQNEQPTPEPTGDSSASTTVYVSGQNSFALLLPQNSGGYLVHFVSGHCDSCLGSQRWCPMQKTTVLRTVRMKVCAEILSQKDSSQGLRTRQRRMDRMCRWVW